MKGPQAHCRDLTVLDRNDAIADHIDVLVGADGFGSGPAA